jgi:hypothetical protein
MGLLRTKRVLHFGLATYLIFSEVCRSLLQKSWKDRSLRENWTLGLESLLRSEFLLGIFGSEFVMVVERPRKSNKKESLVVGSSTDILNWSAFNKYSAWKIGASENFSSLPLLRFFFFFFFFFSESVLCMSQNRSALGSRFAASAFSPLELRSVLETAIR